MAVDTSHRISLLSQEFFSNREVGRSMNSTLPSGFLFPSATCLMLPNDFSVPSNVFPLSPAEYTSLIGNKDSMNNKADSGLTCSVPPLVSSVSDLVMPKKRLRDECDGGYSKCAKLGGELSPWMDADLVFQMNQQQSEIDRYIAEHTQRVRIELEERRKRHSRVLAEAVQECIMRKLREKDDEVSRLGKLNWALQERVKSLCVENQVWRDLAQTNEATANSLRTNLEQVLAHVGEDRAATPPSSAEEDAVSSCGSSQPDGTSSVPKPDTTPSFRSCKICAKFESTVLLLPCRHLCLCTTCASSSFTSCPVCSSPLSATVHVNMS